MPRYPVPDAANPRVRRTRDRMLEAARELLSEAGPAGLTYSELAARAGVTRQTLYRHWPARSALLVDLILDGPGEQDPAQEYPRPNGDARSVATAWLASLRAGMRDAARRAAVLAVTAQADTDPDSAQALIRITEDRRAALNELLAPSGAGLGPDEYALLTGPVLARIFFERGEATDELIASIVTQWLANRAMTGTQ
jgi:AcrR family transcriptional regulator